MVKSRYLLLAVWAVIILVLCGLPPQDVEKMKLFNFPQLDKFVHMALYLGFGLFVMAVLTLHKRLRGTKTIYLIAIAICALYGWIIELLQRYLFVGRSYELLDLLADIIGAVLGVLLYNWLSGRFKRMFNIPDDSSKTK